MRLLEPIFFMFIRWLISSGISFQWFFFLFRIGHERKLKTKTRKTNGAWNWAMTRFIHSFIQFHAQSNVKVVNNPFTVIHYGQHFSHSFVHVDDKRDQLIKKTGHFTRRNTKPHANLHRWFSLWSFLVIWTASHLTISYGRCIKMSCGMSVDKWVEPFLKFDEIIH